MSYRYFMVLILCCMPLMAVAQDGQIPLWRGDAGIFQAEDLIRQRKFSESLDILSRILKRNIRNTDAHVESAIAWYNLGNLDKANEAINNALSIDRAHMGAYVMAGLIALKKDNKTQAEFYLNALAVTCQADTCPEYKVLQHAIREAN